MSYLTLLIYPVILAIALVNAKFYKKGEYNTDYLSIDETKAVQGLAAICIVCHHTAQQTCAPWLASGNIVHGLDIFVRTGFLFNAIFLFCSGYGLFKSYVSKKNYLKGFLKKRIFPVWFPYFIVCFLFTFVRLYVLKENMSLAYKITNFTGITIGYSFGWYVQAILIFYVIFYFAFKYSRDKFDASLITLGGVVIWIITGLFVDHNIWFLRGEWWYNATLLFAIGIFYAMYEKKISEFLKKHYAKLVPTVSVLFLIFISLSIYEESMVGYYGDTLGFPLMIKMNYRLITYAFQVLAAIMFVLLIVLICMKVAFSNKVSGFLGNHAFEIYLTHAFFLETIALLYNWEKTSVFYGRPWLLLLVTFAGTIPSAMLLKKLSGIVVALVNNKRGSK